MCSIEALLSRVAKKKGFPSINPLVDLANAVSIKYALPIGAHDLGTVEEELAVRFAVPGDAFTAFGGTETETPDDKELLYVSGHQIRTRRWIWRQSEVGKITEDTTAVFFPIDGFANVNKEQVIAARDELSAMLERFFGCLPGVGYVDQTNPRFEMMGNKPGTGDKYFCRMDTPAGEIIIAEDGAGISDLYFSEQDDHAEGVIGAKERETPLLQRAAAQIYEYFGGKRRVFDLPLSLNGTAFQMADWQALQAIPYGETRSYKQIAEQIGKPKAYRAVGMANNRNPVSIIIPCHRVVGHNGALVGYGGGLPVKDFLLSLEQKNHHP
jgi:O-6-methylguanine DNA methyltransferase